MATHELPFRGYNIGDDFNHWLLIGRKLQRGPRLFMVKWFRKDRDGSFLWPGYGENLRVLKWIVDRVTGRVDTRATPIGLLPEVGDPDLDRLAVANDQLTEVLAVRRNEWRSELDLQEESFASIGETLPSELEVQLERARTGVEAGGHCGGELWNLACRTA